MNDEKHKKLNHYQMKTNNIKETLWFRTLLLFLITIVASFILVAGVNLHKKYLMKVFVEEHCGIIKIDKIEQQSRGPRIYMISGEDINLKKKIIWLTTPWSPKISDLFSVFETEGITLDAAIEKAHTELGRFSVLSTSLIYEPISSGGSFIKQNSNLKKNVYWRIKTDGTNYVLIDFFTGKSILSQY